MRDDVTVNAAADVVEASESAEPAKEGEERLFTATLFCSAKINFDRLGPPDEDGEIAGDTAADEEANDASPEVVRLGGGAGMLAGLRPPPLLLSFGGNGADLDEDCADNEGMSVDDNDDEEEDEDECPIKTFGWLNLFGREEACEDTRPSDDKRRSSGRVSLCKECFDDDSVCEARG